MQSFNYIPVPETFIPTLAGVSILIFAIIGASILRLPAPRSRGKLRSPIHSPAADPSPVANKCRTVETRNGLLTPPASPSLHSTNAYHTLLSSSLPGEFWDANDDLLEDVLFGDMDPAVWSELLGGVTFPSLDSASTSQASSAATSFNTGGSFSMVYESEVEDEHY